MYLYNFIKHYIPAECGGIIRSSTGILRSSEANLNSYDHHMECTWVFLAPLGNIVEITWLSFDIEDSSSCQFDYIQIFDNSTTQFGSEIGKFCGTNIPPPIISSSNLVSILFKTDGSRNAGGWSLAYRYLDASSCK